MATAEKTAAPKGGDAGQAELQKYADKVEEQGYEGHVPDETPNENYSLETPQDAPVPETTERVEQAEKANADKIALRKKSK